MDDLVAWLRQQLDEEKRKHRRVLAGDSWDWLAGSECESRRVLRDGAGDRAILSDWLDAVARRDYYERDGEEPFVSEVRAELKVLERVIRWRALSRSDRPGYREEWRP
jgi:hypothetical protein